MTERQLPHSVDAEQATLGAILASPRLFPEVSALLATDDFFMPAHREIWESLSAVDRSGRPIDALLAIDDLRARGRISLLEGGDGYLLKIMNETPALSNVRHYADIVAEKAIARRLIAACGDVISRAYAGETDASDLVDEHAGALLKISTRSSNDLVTIRPLVEAAMDTFERRQQSGNPITGVRTGIEKLDRYTGGLQPGQHIVVAARPGLGKTALGIDIAIRHALAGGVSLIFSLEMTKEELVERMYAFRAGVDSHHLRRGEISAVGWHNLTRAQIELAAALIYVVDDQTRIGQIEATTRRVRARHPDAQIVGVLDYVQLTEVKAGKGETIESALGDVSKRIKRLAKATRMPIVDLSQLNRESEKEKRPPRLSDLRQTGALEQDADVVVFIDDPAARREPKFKDDPPPEKTVDGPVDLILAKNRNGITGVFSARWVAKFFSFLDDDSGSRYEPGDTK